MSYYTERLAEYGSGVRALGWGSEESQRLRFGILAEIADLTGRTVLDFGCGFGDLSRYLHGQFYNVRYTGYDNDAAMLAEARKKYPDSRFADQPVEADYVLSSGVFNLAKGVRIDDLMMLWQLCRKGVAVNFTSALAESRTPGIAYADPFDVARLGAALARKFTLRHDYKSNDFTLYLFR